MTVTTTEASNVEVASAGSAAAAAVPSSPASKRHRRIRWRWNWKLLIGCLVGLAVVGVSGAVAYFAQSGRTSAAIRARAEESKQSGNVAEYTKWMRQLLALNPQDSQTLYEYSIAVDEQAELDGAPDTARRQLLTALGTLSDNAEFATQAQDLRRRAIRRLSQLGPSWVNQLEQEIFKLQPPPDDPPTIKALSSALLTAKATGSLPYRDPDQFKRQADYWRWLSSQPVGQVAEAAVLANPEDTELAGRLLDAYVNNPDWFAKLGEQANREELNASAKALAEKLRQKTDDPRAQWYAFVYVLRTDADGAPAQIVTLGPAALERLRSNADAAVEDRWADLQLALAYASNQQTKSPAESEVTYSQILGLRADAAEQPQPILDPMFERAGVGFGQAALAQGNPVLALERWRDVKKRVAPESLELQSLIASVAAEQPDTKAAQQEIDQLTQLANQLSARLSSTPGLTEAARLESLSLHDAARWRALVLGGRLALSQKDLPKACELLEQARASTANIDPQARLLCMQLLAESYAALERWDQSGRALDEAISLAPSNQELLKAAAEVWSRAGISDKSMALLRQADDGSFNSGLAIAESLFDLRQQGSADPQNQDLLLSAIRSAAERFQKLTPEDPARSDAWRLELLALRVGLPAQTDRFSSNATDAVDRLRELAEQFPSAARLQAVAAVSLAASGQAEASDASLVRLAGAIDQELQKPGEQTESSRAELRSLLPIARAQVAAQKAPESERLSAALQVVEEFVRADASLQSVLRGYAAQVAAGANQPMIAYQQLSQIPEDQRSLEQLVQLVQLADQLSRNPESDDSTRVPRSEVDQWDAALRAKEGPQGTLAKLLEAERKMNDAESAANPTALLEQVSALQQQLLVVRPGWGLAHALAGRVAAKRGQTATAIEELQRAMDGGDQRVSTAILLVEQLTLARRPAQAEKVLARVSRYREVSQKISTLEIGLAERMADFSRALDLARAETERRPRLALPWLLVAQTAYEASVAAADSTKSAELRKEAQAALDRALELSGGTAPQVWEARIRFQAAIGDRESAISEVEAMDLSKLPQLDKLLLAGRYYATLGELNKSSDRFRQAIGASNNPKQQNDARLLLAEVQRQQNKFSEAIQTLEEALSVEPTRQDLKTALALLLALQSGAEVPWDRVESLIGTATQSPITNDGDGTSSARNQLVLALLILNRAGDDRVEQDRAIDILRRLIAEVRPEADDARRMWASIERRRWQVANESDQTAVAAQHLQQAIQLYEDLTNKPEPQALDLYRYADLLLVAKRYEELVAVENSLMRIAGGSPAALDITTRRLQATDQRDSIPQAVANWLSRAVVDSQSEPAALELAGQALSQFGFHEQAINYLEKAFAANPRLYRQLALALGRQGRFDRAFEILRNKVAQDSTGTAIILLADLVTISAQVAAPPADIERILKSAAEQYAKRPEVLESLGTWHLAREEFADAVRLYETADRLSPNDPRILNNLAMALSEIPSRSREALPYIERVIEAYGRAPELLDTRGVTLLRVADYAGAEAAFREAIKNNPDPRFRLHLIEALEQAGQLDEARAEWALLDQHALRTAVLTPAEMRALKELPGRLGLGDSYPAPIEEVTAQ